MRNPLGIRSESVRNPLGIRTPRARARSNTNTNTSDSATGVCGYDQNQTHGDLGVALRAFGLGASR